MAGERRTLAWLILAFAILFSGAACGSNASTNSAASSTTAIPVVAAENFYGNIVQQLGGKRVAVTSILSDPNVDPHEYESSVRNAEAVADARLVIANGGGYDDWMDKLLSASPSSSRIVLKGFDLAPHKLPDNEHVWYSIDDIESIARVITGSLTRLDPGHTADFERNLRTFTRSLKPIQQKMGAIKARYAGTPIGLTETIYLYQAVPMGLNVLTPADFQKAIAEGNDPPADSVIAAQDQITRRQIKVLIYNEQTITPVTTKLQNAARAQHIPIMPVTETMPSGKTYQQWMLDQLNTLEQSLAQSK
jgi:zinc/manganese transport system substrate-binding protein